MERARGARPVRGAQPGAACPGRLTLITRMGADHVEERLRPLLRAVTDAGHPVVWACDPMHGNTFTAPSGRKTRHFDDIVRRDRRLRPRPPRRGHVAGRHPRRAHRRQRHRVPRRRRRVVGRRPRRPLRDDVRPAAERAPEPRPRVPRRRARRRRSRCSVAGAGARADRDSGRSPTSPPPSSRADGTVLGAAGDVDHRFRLASLTKPIAGWAMLVAVEEGTVALDDAGRPARLHAAPPARPRRGLRVRRPRPDRRPGAPADLLEHRDRAGRRPHRATAAGHAVRRLPRRGRARTARHGRAARSRDRRPTPHGPRSATSAGFLAELQRPTLLAADDRGRGASGRSGPTSPVSSPGWVASIRARGGWASRSGALKRRTGPARRNSAATFGHFGGAAR